jgi:chemotaxis protein MotA
MDIATAVGVLVGGLFIFLGIIGGEFNFEDLKGFMDARALMIVGGGLLAACCISFPIKDLLRMPRVYLLLWRLRKDSPMDLINKLVQFAEIARRDGILALEGVTESLDDEFLIRGIQLAVDGTDPELIEQIMNTELDQITERHMVGKRLFDSLTKYGPSWALFGTITGMVLMLRNLGNVADPGAIGRGMAVALVCTFYGLIVAYFLFGPAADKLLSRHEDEMLMRHIVIRGVLAIQSGDNPRIVEQKLRVFLPPRMRSVETRK